MAELVLGAALGTAFSELYDAVDEATLGKSKKIKFLVAALQSTLDSIQPLVMNQIGDFNVKLGLPNDEVEELQKRMMEGEALICKLLKLRWWKRIKSRNIVQLIALDASLKRLMQHIVLEQARDIKENLLLAKQTAAQLAEFQEFNERLLREQTLLREDAKESQEKVVLQLHKNREELSHLKQSIDDAMKLREARGVIDDETEDLGGADDLMSLYAALYENVANLSKQNVMYKHIHKRIKSTLSSTLSVSLSINDGMLSYVEKRQMHRLAMHMRDGVNLASRCLKAGNWNIYQSLSNINKLIQWDESLKRERDKLIAILDGQINVLSQTI